MHATLEHPDTHTQPPTCPSVGDTTKAETAVVAAAAVSAAGGVGGGTVPAAAPPSSSEPLPAVTWAEQGRCQPAPVDRCHRDRSPHPSTA
jgi:hypothetical protein